MILPYYRNGTLHDYLTKKAIHNEYLDVRDILRIFLDICEGLKCFHDMKPEPLAHRDLKTANICLTDSMSPVIMDLGKFKKVYTNCRENEFVWQFTDKLLEKTNDLTFSCFSDTFDSQIIWKNKWSDIQLFFWLTCDSQMQTV